MIRTKRLIVPISIAVGGGRAARLPLYLPVYLRVLGVLLLCLAMAARVPAASRAGRIEARITDGGDPRFGVVEAWRAPSQAGAIGVRWERISFWWKYIQPSGPSSWNSFATGRDHYINNELAAGRKLAGLLINTPDWAAAHPAQHGTSVPAGLYLPYDDPHNYWGHFVGLMAKHYAGRIDDWILWNEVNIPNGHWNTWNGSVADYAQLVKVASLAAKAANPRARIVLYGDPYWYDHGSFFASLLQRLSRDPAAAAHQYYFDVANIHLYSRPKDLAPIITLYRDMMARFGLHKPVWIGETNAIPYDDPVRHYPRSGYFASLSDQASYIVQAFAIDLAMNVERIEVNRMIDGTDFIAGGEPFGLIRNDHSARPAYYAYRTAVALFSHATGGTFTRNNTTGVYTVVLHRPGAVVTVVWDQNPVAATARVAALSPTAIVYDKLGSGRAVRASGGSYTFALAPATGNTDANDPHDYVMGGSPIILVQPS